MSEVKVPVVAEAHLVDTFRRQFPIDPARVAVRDLAPPTPLV